MLLIKQAPLTEIAKAKDFKKNKVALLYIKLLKRSNIPTLLENAFCVFPYVYISLKYVPKKYLGNLCSK